CLDVLGVALAPLQEVAPGRDRLDVAPPAARRGELLAQIVEMDVEHLVEGLLFAVRPDAGEDRLAGNRVSGPPGERVEDSRLDPAEADAPSLVFGIVAVEADNQSADAHVICHEAHRAARDGAE